MSAWMWQVALERNVEQYGKLAKFIILMTEMVPELMNYKQSIQLILGLRSRVSEMNVEIISGYVFFKSVVKPLSKISQEDR